MVCLVPLIPRSSVWKSCQKWRYRDSHRSSPGSRYPWRRRPRRTGTDISPGDRAASRTATGKSRRRQPRPARRQCPATSPYRKRIMANPPWIATRRPDAALSSTPNGTTPFDSRAPFNSTGRSSARTSYVRSSARACRRATVSDPGLQATRPADRTRPSARSHDRSPTARRRPGKRR